MRFDAIPAYEASLFAGLNKGDANGRKFLISENLIPIANEPPMTLHRLRLADGSKPFYERLDAFPKQRIVLHWTMGWLKGDIQTLTPPSGPRVSVPFVIARNGKIVQLFDSAHWASHIGSKTMDPGISQTSIGIELSNIGPLTLSPDGAKLLTWTKEEYCKVAETSAYIKLDTPYRDRRYYASFPDAQIEATAQLLRFLTTRYNIPRKFLPEANRYSKLTDKQCLAFRGIFSHVNSRADKKDIGPAFPWQKLIQLVG